MFFVMRIRDLLFSKAIVHIYIVQNTNSLHKLHFLVSRGRPGHDRMVAGSSTTGAISAYHH